MVVPPRIFSARKSLWLFVPLASWGGLASSGLGAPVDFVKEVKPFLEQKCLGCHNPNIAKGDLDLSTAAFVLDPSGSSPRRTLTRRLRPTTNGIVLSSTSRPQPSSAT